MTQSLKKKLSINRFGYIYSELVSLASWVMSDSRLSRSAATEPISALLLQFAKYISLVQVKEKVRASDARKRSNVGAGDDVNPSRRGGKEALYAGFHSLQWRLFSLSYGPDILIYKNDTKATIFVFYIS